jgi:hypothetical protein
MDDPHAGQGPDGERDPSGWIRPRRIYRVTAVRTGIQTDYQLLCGTGMLDLNMIVREVDEPRRLELSGRVLTSEIEPRPVEGLPLTIVGPAGQTIGDTATTNEFGEFALTADVQGDCGIRLGATADSPCVHIREEGL